MKRWYQCCHNKEKPYYKHRYQHRCDQCVVQSRALYPRYAGFTLIELLIAMVIFAILATLAYGGLSSLIRTSSGVEAHIERLEKLQRCVMFLERDLRQLVARPINTDVAARQAAVVMEPNSVRLIDFTRAGNPNPAGLYRSSLQRIRYTLEEGVLTRLSWDYVDHLQSDVPVKLPLLDQLNGVEFRLLDDRNKWQTRWNNKNLTQLPLAVEVVLEHKQWGKIRRLIPVTGL